MVSLLRAERVDVVVDLFVFVVIENHILSSNYDRERRGKHGALLTDLKRRLGFAGVVASFALQPDDDRLLRARRAERRLAGDASGVRDRHGGRALAAFGGEREGHPGKCEGESRGGRPEEGAGESGHTGAP